MPMSKNDQDVMNSLEKRMRMRAGRQAEGAETVRAILRPLENVHTKSINEDMALKTSELHETMLKQGASPKSKY